jgi:hypothetical protein
VPPGIPAGSTGGMFVGDEVRADVSVAVATARLEHLFGTSSLIRASYAAWGEGIARIGPVGPVPGLSKLVRVQVREPVRHGQVTVFTLRWEATGTTERLFPVLDADITLVADGDDATLVGLEGVYGAPAGTAGGILDRALLHRVAASTVRSFLSRIAAAICDPACLDAEGVAVPAQD